MTLPVDAEAKPLALEASKKGLYAQSLCNLLFEAIFNEWRVDIKKYALAGECDAEGTILADASLLTRNAMAASGTCGEKKSKPISNSKNNMKSKKIKKSDDWWAGPTGFTKAVIDIVHKAHAYRDYMKKPLTSRFPRAPAACPDGCYVRFYFPAL